VNFANIRAECCESLHKRPATTGERLRPHGITGYTGIACPRVHPSCGRWHPWNRSSPRSGEPERMPGRERIKAYVIQSERVESSL